MTLLLVVLWGCSGSDDAPTGETGTSDTTPTADTADTPGPETAATGDTAPTCVPSVELGTGEAAFESIGERLDMINGPQGGWHVITAVRLCDLGSEATLTFRATWPSNDEEVGGSGTFQRLLLPDGDCCHVAVDVFTYLLVDGYPRPADALHDEPVRLDVEVLLPDGTVWTDEAETVFVDSTLYATE